MSALSLVHDDSDDDASPLFGELHPHIAVVRPPIDVCVCVGECVVASRNVRVRATKSPFFNGQHTFFA